MTLYEHTLIQRLITLSVDNNIKCIIKLDEDGTYFSMIESNDSKCHINILDYVDHLTYIDNL